MRRKKATLRCKEATQLGAPSRLKGAPPQTRAPILERVDETERTEKVEHLQGRTDIVHKHCKELFTDPSQAEVPEWIEQRWPCETHHSLPMIDGERVQKTRELDSDVWETIASCFRLTLMNHWAEDVDKPWKTTARHHGQEKEWQAHHARLPSDCHAADCLPSLL